MRSEVVFLSLGSNLGDRESNLAQATIALSINYQISDIISSSIDRVEGSTSSSNCRDTKVPPFSLM